MAKIREAKARLEAEARAQAKTNNAAATRSKSSVKPKAASGGAKNPPDRPHAQDKRNELHRRRSEGHEAEQQGIRYSYNAQAVVDSAEQIIVAAETTNEANDKQQAVPMARAALDNLNAAGIKQPKAADGTPTPIPNTAETVYFSKEAVEEVEKMGIDPQSPQVDRDHEARFRPRRQRLPPKRQHLGRSECEGKDAEKLRTATGQALYAAQAHRRAGIRHDQVRARDP